MKKYILLLMAAMFLVACSNETVTEDKEASATEQLEKEVDEEDGENNVDKIDQDKVNSGVMKLGDTGFVDDGINRYEITPMSFEIFKERSGISVNNDDEVFVLIDYTVKNMSEESFEEEDILMGSGLLLKNSQGNIATEITYYDYDFVDKITETIEPEESYDSQLLFEVPVSESSEYTLHYESYPEDVEDADWVFTEDEAK